MNDSGQNPDGRHSLASDAKTTAKEDMTLAETLEAERAIRALSGAEGPRVCEVGIKK
jgi:hypothetical protein